MKGAEIVVSCLIEQGIKHTFGYPGGGIIDITDMLGKHKNEIMLITTAHEQGATHAAEGYACITRGVGVCIVTSGPGVTNATTGINDAYKDSVPLVVITGDVPTNQSGHNGFQEVNTIETTKSMTKDNFIVKDIKYLADTIRKAFKIALEGRPGPVVIVVPKDIQQAESEYSPLSPIIPTLEFNPVKSEINKVITILENARKPLIYAGGGCIISNASESLQRFAELIDSPIALSMKGLGIIPTSHKLYLGMIGMHGHMGVAKALEECDVVIAIGTRFSDRSVPNFSKFAPKAKKIHIDIDETEINKNVQTDAYIVGDVKDVLDYLILDYLEKYRGKKNNDNWIRECKDYKNNFPLKHGGTGALCPHKIIKMIGELTTDDQIIATDVGQHQVWTAQIYPFSKPRTFLTSGGLGTMGYGYGAAIGAAFASKKQVVLITSDGSFHMNFNETITAVRYNLPIKIFLMNNKSLGMVRQWQKEFYDNRCPFTKLNSQIDYVKLMEALGAKGFTLDKDEDINLIVKKALNEKGPTIVVCDIPIDAKALPMIPPGKTIDDIITD